ncbi:hypothetical protein ACIPWF_16900 [Paenarthrobacter sp. NPDC089989]
MALTDTLEVWKDGHCICRGRMLSALPGLDMVWVADERTGLQLLDLAMLRSLQCVVRIVGPSELAA